MNDFNEKHHAVGYTDSDWKADCADRKSVSGLCLSLYGNVIMWATRKQKTVSLSTVVAEYVALSCAIAFKRLEAELPIRINV